MQPEMDMVIQVEKYYHQSGHFICMRLVSLILEKTDFIFSPFGKILYQDHFPRGWGGFNPGLIFRVEYICGGKSATTL